MNLRHTLAISAAFAVALHLAGCDKPAPAPAPAKDMPGEPAPIATASASAPAPGPGPAPAMPVATKSADALTSLPPVTATTAPPVSAATDRLQPASVLSLWGAAVERRDWAQVRALWGNKGADSGLSPRAFAARWDTLRRPRVFVGPGEQEGAAGSSFYTVPVRIVDGARVIAGDLTIRRVNDVDGASTEQLRWHADGSVRGPWTTLKAG